MECIVPYHSTKHQYEIILFLEQKFVSNILQEKLTMYQKHGSKPICV